jgi:uncharacterized protein YacL
VDDPASNLNPLEASQRQRAVLLRIVRISFVVLLFTVTLLNILSIPPAASPSEKARVSYWPLTLGVALVLAGIVIVVDVFTPRKKISTLFSIFFGLLGAMLVSLAMGVIIDLLATSYDIKDQNLIALVKVLLGIALAYLGITTVLQTQDDFRLVIPYVEFAKELRGARPLVLDTSVLIDARFAELANTGIVQSPLVIPQFVVGELQLLADSGEKQKRARGRRGLAVVSKLQRAGTIDVTIDQTPIVGIAVDQMLVELARVRQAILITTDSALSRVAQIQGVPSINVHDVATSLRPALAPGEPLTVSLVRAGEQPHQAVGYLDDGTMVVADESRALIGQSAALVVTSAIQTAAGRMIFARRADVDVDETDASGEQSADSAEPTPADAAPEASAGAGENPDVPPGPPADAPARTPFPPKPPRSIRGGTPRNPRR